MAAIPSSRVATVKAFSMWQLFLNPDKIPPRMLAALIWPPSLTFRSLGRVKMFGPRGLASARCRAVELPSGNGLGTTRESAP